MPFRINYKNQTKHIEVKYERGTLSLKFEDFRAGSELSIRTGTDRSFLLKCLAAASIGIAVLGVTVWMFKDLIKLGWTYIFAPRSAIYKVIVPMEQEKEFDEFVTSGKLLSELQEAFGNIKKHLIDVLGDEAERYNKTITKLSEIKIDSVEICDEKIALEAFEEMYAKHPRIQAIQAPSPPDRPGNLSVREGPKSPNTSVFVSFNTVDQAESYIVTAHDLENDSKKEVQTHNVYCVVDGLEAGHSYIFGVRAIRDGMQSRETLCREPWRTIEYDPYPWRDADDGESIPESGIGRSTTTSEGIPSDTAEGEFPELWNSDLHVKLRKIFRRRFNDGKMKRLLSKCDELGIVEANDLKFVENQEIADEFKGTVKKVEVLKLMDYAKDQQTTTPKLKESSRKGTIEQGNFVVGKGASVEIRNILQ